MCLLIAFIELGNLKINLKKCQENVVHFVSDVTKIRAQEKLYFGLTAITIPKPRKMMQRNS